MDSDPDATDPCTFPTATWFTSGPLAQDLVLVGAPRLTLSATTTAADFDVHVDLYDYLAATDAYRTLGTGVLRARYRTGTDTALPAGSPVALEVTLTASARRIPAGHQLTIAISPSRCGYVENPNTGQPAEGQTSRSTASVAFVLGPQGARLTLPQPP